MPFMHTTLTSAMTVSAGAETKVVKHGRALHLHGVEETLPGGAAVRILLALIGCSAHQLLAAGVFKLASYLC
jgi:hypothetical protein